MIYYLREHFFIRNQFIIERRNETDRAVKLIDTICKSIFTPPLIITIVNNDNAIDMIMIVIITNLIPNIVLLNIFIKFPNISPKLAINNVDENITNDDKFIVELNIFDITALYNKHINNINIEKIILNICTAM